MNDLDIKEIRAMLGVSQDTLAEMIGVHIRTIQNWEAGSKIPKSKYAILHNLIEHQPEPELKPRETVPVDRDVLETIRSQQETIASQQKLIQQLTDIITKNDAQEAGPVRCAGVSGA